MRPRLNVLIQHMQNYCIQETVPLSRIEYGKLAFLKDVQVSLVASAYPHSE